MFVRWKRRKTRRGDELLSAVLVESVRVEGKPRQRIVKYLASIHQSYAQRQWWRPCKEFWEKATAELDSLELTKRERREIESRMRQVVPKPTKAMQRRALKRLEAMERPIRKALGR